MNPSKQVKNPVADLLDATADAKQLLQSYANTDFASGTHTHILSDVEELVDALASKYDSSHVGTTANKLVQLTAAAKLPAVDGSLLTRTYDAKRFVYGLSDTCFRKWQLAYAKQRVGTKIATIVCNGDSTTAGQAHLGSNYWLNSFPGRIRTYFNTLTGVDSGTGWIKTNLGLTETGAAPDGGSHAMTTTRTGSWVNFGGIGVYDSYASNTNGDKISYTWTGPEKLRIFTYRGIAGSYGGTHTSTLDGGSATSISNASPQAVIATDFTPVGSGSHTVELTVSGGYLTVLGVELRPASDASSGVVVHNCGYSSQTSVVLAGNTDAYQTQSRPAHISLLAPDLTIILIGTNDATFDVTPAAYKTNMQTMITAAKVTGDVLLMTPTRDSSSGLYAMQLYYDKLFELADENDVPLFDSKTRYNTGGALTSATDYSDSIGHWTNLGVQDVAKALQTIIPID